MSALPSPAFILRPGLFQAVGHHQNYIQRCLDHRPRLGHTGSHVDAPPSTVRDGPELRHIWRQMQGTGILADSILGQIA